jgi:hypothetical protein
VNLKQYADHRKSLGLRGQSHVAVIKAINDERLTYPAVQRHGRNWVINAELADEQWATRTDPSEYGGMGGGTDRPIGISALIGFLMLIGIVVTNAIVLLDRVEQLRHEGVPTKDALLRAGATRVRPILMTAVATILALVPLAAGPSEGSIIAAELGTVVIGGLLSSTLLTLLVVPVVYSLVDGLKESLSRGKRVKAA